MVESILLSSTALSAGLCCFLESKYYLNSKLKKNYKNLTVCHLWGSLYETGRVNLHCSEIKLDGKGVKPQVVVFMRTDVERMSQNKASTSHYLVEDFAL